MCLCLPPYTYIYIRKYLYESPGGLLPLEHRGSWVAFMSEADLYLHCRLSTLRQLTLRVLGMCERLLPLC